MDIDQIKALTDLMVDNGLTEIMIKDGEDRIVLRRGGLSSGSHMLVSQAMPHPSQGFPPAAAPAGQPAAPAVDPRLGKVVSPMVGTFYASPSPDAPPFVTVGSKVGPDTVVCIIEAMKVFNEIKAEISGTVESVEVQTGKAVEFGQILFTVRTN